MAIERKDVRLKLDDDKHAALKAICELDDVDMGVFIELLLVPVIDKRVHDAIELAGKLQRLGMAGSHKTVRGVTGSGDKGHTGGAS
jgi:hypothetical protein